VLPFEILPFEPPTPAPTRPAPHVTDRTLPLYVAPLADESLFSWLQRLTTRLQVPFHTLTRQSFGIDDSSGRTLWWHRPHPWTLARIAKKTGVSISRMRKMTFEDLQPPFRQDEDSARFSARRYDTRAPDWRAYRLALCGVCLQSDPVPYVRTLWQLGWLAVCPKHHTILITRCAACRSAIRIAPFATATPFSPTTCIRCGETLLTGYYSLAHPSVVRLQEAFLKGKREGVTEFDGLGAFTWHQVVALADTLLGALWTDTTLDECNQVLRRYEHDDPDGTRREMQIYDCRHDSLRFLAWLIEGWPDSAGAVIGHDMLTRGLRRTRNRLSHHVLPRWKGHPWSPSPHDYAPEIVARMWQLWRSTPNVTFDNWEPV
jgi:hypothetical protein